MKIPKALRVVSIILIVSGAIRLIAGFLGFIVFRGFYDENPDIVIQVIIENFVAGPLILISGLLLLKGKAIGRILMVIGAFISWVAPFIISKEYSIGSLVISGVLIAILFLEDNIKLYFSNKD